MKSLKQEIIEAGLSGGKYCLSTQDILNYIDESVEGLKKELFGFMGTFDNRLHNVEICREETKEKIKKWLMGLKDE